MADSRRSARLREIVQKTPHPPHIRRSSRLEFPGVPYERQIERKTVFPLMSLPRELRDMVYSKALELGFEDLLGVSKQVREEARPYLWKSRFFVLGKGGMLIDYHEDPQRETVLYPRFPDDIRSLGLAWHDHVVNKLALIQNLAVEIDFNKLRSTSGLDGLRPMLRQSSSRDRRGAIVSGVRLPTLGPPVGLLEPFLSPQGGSNRRNTCEITLMNWINYYQASVNTILEVMIRLRFKNIFVAFESPKVPRPGEHRGDIRRRFHAYKKTLEAGLGPAIWHDSKGGYLAFHPSR